MSYSIVKGDLEPPLPLTLKVNGAAYDGATGAPTVQLRWTKPDGTTSLVALVAVNAAAGVFERQWEAGDTEQVGTHRGQVIVTRAGRPRTFPSVGTYAQWQVNPQLPPP